MQAPTNYIPKRGDKYRALSALRYFQATGAQWAFMVTLIDRCNGETGRCDPGTGSLCRDSKSSKSTATRARAYWRRKGVISYQLRGEDSASYQINWTMLNQIFYKHYRETSEQTIAKRLAKIEEIKRNTGVVSEANSEWLEEIGEQFNAHQGEGLGGWAYRLLTEG